MNDKPEKMPPVPPFVRFVASAVPMVFDNSLSYYEALCALWKYIQDMSDVVNNNATLEEEFIEKVNELETYVNTYFDNLDVQEEINTKLDAMAEAGTLSDIISQYLNSTAIFGYDTVADMVDASNLTNGSFARTLGYSTKNDGSGALYKIRTITNDDVIDGTSIIAMNDVGNTLVAELIVEPVIHTYDTLADMKVAPNLVNGTYARTLGYYAINDNGGGLYKIRTITNDDVVDEGSIVAMDDNTLVAEIIIEQGDVIVNQFGAKGDNTTDDSTAIQNAINYSATIGLNSILLINKFYYCNSGLVVNAADFRIHGRPACEYTSALRFDNSVSIGIDVKNYGFRLDNISIRGTDLSSASTGLIGLRLQRPTGGGTNDEIEAAMNIDADITNCIFLWLHEAILAKGRNINVVDCDFGECENGFELDYLASGHSHRDIWIRDSRFHNIGANKRDTGADYAYGFAIIFPSTWVRADIYGNIIRNNFFDYCNNVFTGCILGCTISGNNILDCLHNGIVAVNPGTGAMTSNNNIEVMISNNNINIRGDQSNYGIYLKGVSRPRIIGNVIANQPTIAVLLETCGTIWFVDNSLNCIRTDITENLKIIGASGDEVFLQGNLFSRFSNNNNTFVNISGVSKVYTGGNVSNGGSTAIVCNVTPLKQGEDAHFW